MFKLSTKSLAINAMLAALYVVLTVAAAPLSYGGVQFRISEMLVLLAFFNAEYIIGVSIGTFLANYIGPFGLPDAIFGTLVSILAMLLIYSVGKSFGKKLPALFLASLFPVILNGVYVSTIIIVLDKLPWDSFMPIAVSVGIGEFVVVSIAGSAIY